MGARYPVHEQSFGQLRRALRRYDDLLQARNGSAGPFLPEFFLRLEPLGMQDLERGPCPISQEVPLGLEVLTDGEDPRLCVKEG